MLGIRGEVENIAPTETVKLETRQFYQDFNYAMKEGNWVHLEFESDEITREDLKRSGNMKQLPAEPIRLT